MSDWNSLPTEVLLRIIGYCNPMPNHLGSASLVCTTWRIAAIKIAFRKIDCRDQNAFKLKQMVKKEIAGHSARTLYIGLDNSDELKSTLLHFAIYCPNLTVVKCSPSLKKLTWIYLAQLSTKYFKNLTELPGPEKKEQIDEYSVCALMYRDRIMKHYVIGHHPSSSQGKFQVLQLQDFLKIQHLCITADKSRARLFDFDKMIDSCPRILRLTTTMNGHPQLDTWELEDYDKALYEPHQHINTLFLNINFDEYAFDYIFHKFPNLKKGTISINNTRSCESYFIAQLNTIKELTFYKSITLKITVPYETLVEMIKQTAIKTLKMNFAILKPRSGHGKYLDLSIKKETFEVKELGNISRSDLLGVLRASATSTSKLKIQESGLETTANPMTTIVDILAHMNNLVKLEYTSLLHSRNSNTEERGARNLRTMFMPIEPITCQPNDSLKFLDLYGDRIDEGIYPFFSSHCPKLCRLRIHLENGTGQNIYTIRMSNIHFRLFEFDSEHPRGILKTSYNTTFY
ncbi:unnamed protein product [Rhizopus stolonifer]